MGVFSRTLPTLIRDIADSLDDLVMGTPSSVGSTSTVVCTNLIYGQTDFFEGWNIHFYAGPLINTTREITGFNTGTYTITFAPVVGSSTSTSDLFICTKKHTWSQYTRAINRAILQGSQKYLLPKIDETTELEEDVYEYNVPSGFVYIKEIILEDSDDEGIYYSQNKIDNRAWEIVPGTTPQIHFDEVKFSINTDRNGLKLRIIGQQIESELSADTDTCEMPPEYIIEFARSILLAKEGKLEAAGYAHELAESYRKQMRIMPEGTPVYEG